MLDEPVGLAKSLKTRRVVTFPICPVVHGASKKTPGIPPGIPTGHQANRQATAGSPGKSPGKPSGHQPNRQANRRANRQANRWAFGHSDWWLEKAICPAVARRFCKKKSVHRQAFLVSVHTSQKRPLHIFYKNQAYNKNHRLRFRKKIRIN